MSNLVPTNQGSLIFQPTENLAARVVSAEDEREEAKKELKAIQDALAAEKRKRQGQAILSAICATAAIACLGVAGFLYFVAVPQAEAREAAAVAARAEAVEAQEAAERLAEQRLDEVVAFDPYRELANLTFQIRSEKLELDSYRSQLAGKPTPGLNTDDTDEPNYVFPEVNERAWIGDIEVQLETDLQKLQTAVKAIEDWALVRGEPIQPVQCLPANPLRPTARPAACP